LKSGTSALRVASHADVLRLVKRSKLKGATIPDKRVETRSKFSPHPTFNVDNQVIFALFVGKNAIFSNID